MYVFLVVDSIDTSHAKRTSDIDVDVFLQGHSSDMK